MASTQALLSKFRTALQSFTASSSTTFQVLHTVPSAPKSPTSKLFVLDSSFNPPNRAHLRIATTALLSSTNTNPQRLLLLLATQNADKAPTPAAFEQRLAMMAIFAEDLVRSLKEARKDADVAVDIGVTKKPYFIDKCTAVDESGVYRSGIEQTHLIGFDTLIRILDPKYYPPMHTLAPLQDLFGRHSLRMMYRTDDQFGEKKEQDEYIKQLGDGTFDTEGWRSEWLGSIEFVEGLRPEDVVSSTKARKAAAARDAEALGEMCTDGVAGWVLDEILY